MKKIKNIGEFLTLVKESAANIKGSGAVYDLSDEITQSYARNLFLSVKESAGVELTELFKWTTDDLCDALTKVEYGDDLKGEEDEVKESVKKISEDAWSMDNLLKKTSDVDLLSESLGIVSESTPEDNDMEGKEDEEELDEALESAAVFNIVDEIDETSWEDVDTGALKTVLREAKEAGVDGIDEVIQEVYASADVEDPSSWKYPHHTVSESGDVRLNMSGLAVASNQMAARFTGTQDDYRIAASSLAEHYTDENTHGVISHVAETSPGIHMVSIEVQDADGNLQTLDNASGELGYMISVTESASNLLRDAGILNVEGPVALQIDNDQLNLAFTNLKEAAKTLMGEIDEVSESTTTELDDNVELVQMKESVALLNKKVDALQSLLEGSPLQGVAESVVRADTAQTVEAFKSVSESIGVKRLITSKRVNKQSLEQINESTDIDDISGLSNLLKDDEPQVVETKKKRDLSIFI